MGAGKAIAATTGAAATFWVTNIGAQVLVWYLSGSTASTLVRSVPAEDLLRAVREALSTGPLGLSFEPTPLWSGIVAGGLVVAAVASAGSRPNLTDPSKAHGDAHLATRADRVPYAHERDHVFVPREGGLAGSLGLRERKPWPKPEWCERLEDDNLILSEHSRVGVSDSPDRWHRPPNRHVYLVAGSGAGKTYNYVTNQALQLNGSYVFTDPKGELFQRFAAFFLSQGYEVRLLDLRGEEEMKDCDRYNPLAYCNDMTSISVIIDMLIKNTNSGEKKSGKSDDFFEKAERQVYSALLGYLFFNFGRRGRRQDCTIPVMLDFLQASKDSGTGTSTLDLVFDGTLEANGFMGYRQQLVEQYGSVEKASQSPEWTVITNWDGFKSTAGSPETMASVLASCFVRLSPFSQAAVRTLFSSDTLDLDQVGQRKTAVFVAIKDTGGPFDFAASMMLYQLFDRNNYIADHSPGGHLKLPVNVIMDELANIGEIPNLPKLFATVRSRWFNLTAIVQDMGQLKAVYGDSSGSILSNCGIFAYYNCSDYETCKKISEDIGNRTVMTQTKNRSHQRGGTSTSTNIQLSKEPLISPEELRSEAFCQREVLTRYTQTSYFRDAKPDPTHHPRWKLLQAAGTIDPAAYAPIRDRRVAAQAQARAHERVRMATERGLPSAGREGSES